MSPASMAHSSPAQLLFAALCVMMKAWGLQMPEQFMGLSGGSCRHCSNLM